MSFIPGDKDRVGKRSYKKWSAESRDTFAKEFADVLKGIRGYPSSLFYFIIYFYVVSIRDFKHSFLHSFNADLSKFAEIGRYTTEKQSNFENDFEYSLKRLHLHNSDFRGTFSAKIVLQKA